MHLLASTQSYIIIAVVVIAAAIAAFYLLRMMKGKIEIELPKTGYRSGEPVTGKVTLEAKKSLDMRRLYVALIGYQIVDRVDTNGQRRSEKHEIYRDEFNLENAKPIPPGFRQTYEFSLLAPGNNSPAGPGPAHTEVERTVASAVGFAVQTLGALGVFGSNNRRLEWKIEARADLPGIDMASSKILRISMM